MQTNFKNIYACGDVVNSPMLAYIASYEAKIAVDNITGKDVEADYSVIPYVLFSGFEIATVGLNEKQAKEKGIEVVTGYYPYTYNEKAVDEHESEGFVRLVFEKESKEDNRWNYSRNRCFRAYSYNPDGSKRRVYS